MENTRDTRALEIIAEWQREDSSSATTMSTYQQVADHFFHRENSITSIKTAGEDKSLPIIDGTGSQDLADMAAGMSAVVFPQGQYFCRLVAEDESQNDIDAFRSYLNYATYTLHRQMFKPSCNFMTQINEFFMSWIGFGTGNIFSGWDHKKQRLFYKDWDVADYRFGVDSSGNPNRCLIRWNYTAQQAFEKFGESVGEKTIKLAQDPKTSQNKLPFIFRVKERDNRDTTKNNNLNYLYAEEVVNETEKLVVQESGYQEFPHHIARWLLSDKEIWGIGQGVFALSTDKELQLQKKALILSADLANNPPRQTLSGFEGTPKVYPGANNFVTEHDQIRALDRNLQGNFPITKEIVEMTKEDLHRFFYVKVFAPLDNLPGDRRTTFEIIERVKAGYMRLILPTMRFYSECLTPLVERTVRLLRENGVLAEPPAGLNMYKIDYVGRLALALQEQQADALQRYSQFSIAMETVIPGFTEEVINVRRAGRRMATTFGVNEGDLNTEEESNAIRQGRIQAKQAQMQMEAMQAAGKAYKDGSGKAESGSPSNAIMESVE